MEYLQKRGIAKEKTSIKNAEEIIKLAILENKVNEAENQYTDITQLMENIVNKLKSEGYNVEEDNDTVSAGKEKIKISDYIGSFKFYEVTINAPKNSIITLKYKDKDIFEKQIPKEASNTTTIKVYREIGDKITAIEKINDEVIYEKTFELQETNTINMYPCEENGDGKALYWYGMEFANFEKGGVSYNNINFSVAGTSCNKNDNNINLSFNDSDYYNGTGIGINYKEDLTNYNEILINIENIEYSGWGSIHYFVGNVPNNYLYVEAGDYENTSSEPLISSGIKNIPISDIKGMKYISIISYNPSGANAGAYGSISFDMLSIVLK